MKDLSANFISEINSQNSGDVFLWLVEASHSSFETLYLVANTEDIVSNGRTYTAFPFKLTLAPDDDGEAPIAKIDFSNVGLELVENIRSVTSPIKFKLQLVLASAPDEIEVEIEQMIGRALEYDESLISFTLTYDDILSISVPSYTYNPLEYGGLF